jgi:CMP-N-acetylneuraminic acid synthetase
MHIIPGAAWALVTARGGSKSIPLKNIHPVSNRPLLDYCLTALRRSRSVSRIITSTDHERIAEVARAHGSDILERPEHLQGDLVASVDVVVDAARTLHEREGAVAEIIVLVQPTSIFLLADHVDAAVQALLDNPDAASSQTVIKVPHQFHAYNQREMSDDGTDIGFKFWRERETCHNKQTKPTFYAYGNLILTRTTALLETGNLFARPSVPVVIPQAHAYDLDGWEDIPLAELMLEKGWVVLDDPCPAGGSTP